LRSDDKPQLSPGGRRRLTVGLAAVAAVPAILLAGCGNANHKVTQDDRPDPRASTEGVQVNLPSPVASDVTQSPDDSIPPENQVYVLNFGKRDN